MNRSKVFKNINDHSLPKAMAGNAQAIKKATR
jgi:hypothetical protein